MTPTEAIEAAKEALRFYAERALYNDVQKAPGIWDTAPVVGEGGKRARAALAALEALPHPGDFQKGVTEALESVNEIYYAPSVSGLTEMERAEGLRLLAAFRAFPDPHRGPPSWPRDVAMIDLSGWLMKHAEALLSPTPSIDWERVGEIRTAHLYNEQMEPGDRYGQHEAIGALLTMIGEKT